MTKTPRAAAPAMAEKDLPRTSVRARGGLPIYPLVVAAFPVLSTIAANLSYAPLDQAWRPLTAVLTGFGLLTLTLCLAFRSTARGAAATAVFAASFFAFSWSMAHPLAFLPRGAFFAWMVLTTAGMGLAAWAAPKVSSLNAFGLCLLAVALGNVGLSEVKERRLAARPATEALGAKTYVGPKPDVFYIILDAHGRADALRRTMGYDESAFIEGLRRRGFYVADRSRSNYCQTELSIPSSMNMDYVSRLLPNVGPDESDRSPLPSLLARSEVERRFRAHGYRFVSVTSGFPPIRFPDADDRLDDHEGMTLIERMLFNLTPMASPRLFSAVPIEAKQTDGPALNPTATGWDADARRRVNLAAFNDLRQLAAPSIQPRFVVVHVLAPHPPFVFGPNGEPVTIGSYHSIDDYELFYKEVGTRADYRKGYTGQVAYIDKLTLAAIDQLTEAAGPRGRPVIIVQGDHGSRMNAAFMSSNHTDVTECFQNLDAFLVPDAVRRRLWSDITPVNEFRVVLDGLFGEGLPILDERCLYSGKDHPYQYVDATPYVQRTVPTSEYGARLPYTVPPSE